MEKKVQKLIRVYCSVYLFIRIRVYLIKSMKLKHYHDESFLIMATSQRPMALIKAGATAPTVFATPPIIDEIVDSVVALTLLFCWLLFCCCWLLLFRCCCWLLLFRCCCWLLLFERPPFLEKEKMDYSLHRE